MHGRRGQSGFSLLEVIIAIFLVSLVVLGIAAAFLTVMNINRRTAEQQRVDHAVSDFTESLKSAAYAPCAGGSTPTSAQRVAPYEPPAGDEVINGVTIKVLDVEFRSADTNGFVVVCPSAGDVGTQRVTVRGEYGDSSRQAQIVLRHR